MSILPHLTLCAVPAVSPAGCVVAPMWLARTVVVRKPVPVSAPVPVDPHVRFNQVQGRLAEGFHRAGVCQSKDYIGPYHADDLWDRLHRTRQGANDMTSQHRGDSPGDEQRVPNDELGAIAHDIGC